jgi:hypothetical protein
LSHYAYYSHMESARNISPILTDNELMKMFADNDDQFAFERLYHKYKEALIRYSFG